MSERAPMLPCCTTSAIGDLNQLANNVPIDTIRNIRTLSFWLKVQIVHNRTKIDALALLDSGAEGNYTHIRFIQKYKIPTFDLASPVYPRNINGTLNQQGAIQHAAYLHMEMADKHQETMEIAITNMGKHDILLGTDWLKTHNPSIDWKNAKLALDRCPHECSTISPITWHITAMELLPTLEWDLHYDNKIKAIYNGIDMSQCIMAHCDKWDNGQDKIQIARTTTSTHLAITKGSKSVEIPLEFRKYHKVFSDEELQRSPKHQPWDHKIDLIPGK